MEFVEPSNTTKVDQDATTSTESTSEVNTKTEETVHELESQVDKAYSVVEAQVSGLWNTASKNATELQEKYKLEEKKKQLVGSLNNTATSINEKTHIKENIQQIEEQLKNLSTKISKEVNFNEISKQANSALDALDSKLEVVEREAGKYVSQFTSFFSNIVSVKSNPSTDTKSGIAEPETLFNTKNIQSYGTSRYDSELLKLHTTASFYTTETANESTDDFSVEEKTDEISKLLAKYPDTLEKLMNKLVPVEVSYELFWLRYFKAENELKASESKRKELLDKNKTDKNGGKVEEEDEDEEEFTWDDDDEEDAIEEAKANVK